MNQLNWINEHLQVILTVAGVIAYWLTQRRSAEAEKAEAEKEAAERSARPTSLAEAEAADESRAERVREEIRRKIAARRSGGEPVRSVEEAARFVIALLDAAGVQQAALVQVPDLRAEIGLEQLRGEAPEEVAQVGHIAQQHALGVVVAGRVHRLGQVDDDRAVGRQQDVELRQVAVHDTRAQHAHHLANQRGVVLQRLLGREGHIVQARGRIAMGVGHQFHQQHAFMKVIRLRHPYTRSGQAVGTLKVLSGTRVLAQTSVTVTEDVPVAGLFGRLWDGLRLLVR